MMLLDKVSLPSLLPKHWATATTAYPRGSCLCDFRNLHGAGTFAFTTLRHSRKDDSNYYQQRGNVTLSVLIGSRSLDSFSVTLQHGARIKHVTSRDQYIVRHIT